MSTTASASPTLARSSSASRRQPSYGSSGDRPHRSQSTRVPTSSYTHSRQSSASQRPGELSNVARRDFEDPNLPRQSSSKRSTSEDRYGQAQATPSSSGRGEPTRRSSRHEGQSAQPSQAPMDPATRSMAAATGAQPRRRTHVTGVTGTWQLQKTIGAGSMGKVKLARNQDTGETVSYPNQNSTILLVVPVDLTGLTLTVELLGRGQDCSPSLHRRPPHASRT